jgi:hypothetical protein
VSTLHRAPSAAAEQRKYRNLEDDAVTGGIADYHPQAEWAEERRCFATIRRCEANMRGRGQGDERHLYLQSLWTVAIRGVWLAVRLYS